MSTTLIPTALASVSIEKGHVKLDKASRGQHPMVVSEFEILFMGRGQVKYILPGQSN